MQAEAVTDMPSSYRQLRVSEVEAMIRGRILLVFLQRFKSDLKVPVDPQVGLIHATLCECASALMTELNAFTSLRATSPFIDWREEVGKVGVFRADVERYLYVAQCQEEVFVILDLQSVLVAAEGGVLI